MTLLLYINLSHSQTIQVESRVKMAEMVRAHTVSRTWSLVWVPPMLEHVQVGMKMARPQCWPSRGQQASHQKWIWGIHCTGQESMQVRDSGFEIQNRHHQNSKNRGISVPMQTLMSSKNFKTNKIKKKKKIQKEKWNLPGAFVFKIVLPWNTMRLTRC